MIRFLNQVYLSGIKEVTIVLHSFEFFYIRSISEKLGKINEINLRRLQGLCRYLSINRERFSVETIESLASRIPLHTFPEQETIPTGRLSDRLIRNVAQIFKRLESYRTYA